MTITRIGGTLGWTLGFPVMITCSVIFFLIMAAALAYRFVPVDDDAYSRDYHDWFGMWACFTIGLAGLLATLVISGVAFWPWHADFHSRYRVQGTVTQTSSRLISDSNHAVSQRYVFTIGGQPFGVDDTRASLVHAGDKVTLICTKEYTWGAAYGWACAWGENP